MYSDVHLDTIQGISIPVTPSYVHWCTSLSLHELTAKIAPNTKATTTLIHKSKGVV